MPPKSEVLIFDSSGENLLREHLHDWSVEVLPMPSELICIPVMLASFLVRGRLSEAYFDAYIRRVSPRLIITFIDNTEAFYRLSLRHPSIKTMFVQNGWRAHYADVFERLDALDEDVGNLKVDYMMCFGKEVGRHYQRHIHGDVVPIGALRNNRHACCIARNPTLVAFISQWRSEGLRIAGRMYSQWEFMGATDHYILGFLSEYSRNHAKSLSIIPRTPRGSEARREETDYYTSILGSMCRFIESDLNGSSYKALDSVQVVVGVDSTLVYESIARGARTAVFAIRGELMGVRGFEYGWPAACPSDGPFWTNSPSHDRFATIMDYLFSISDEGWRKELERTSFNELMAFDPGNGMLKKTLKLTLGT